MVWLSLLTAIALTIFMVEAQIPMPIPVAGVKLGLANIVTLFTLCILGVFSAVCLPGKLLLCSIRSPVGCLVGL